MTGEIILYTSADGAQVQLRTSNGTVWLTQHELADLYGTSVPNIVQIIRRILEDGEQSAATVNSELTVRQEGTRQVRREVKVYNLDMVLAVGYRVTTPRAVQFRQWATTVLREYLVKGFALQDERLKNPDADYFDELLERIRDIRASEKRFYQKVRDIFAATSVDYTASSPVARTFFATIQNKLLYAITGHTAAELITVRIDPTSATLGLTNWHGDHIRKGDVTIAKNYLRDDELSDLNLLTTRFLDFAETRARRRQQTTMAQWVEQTDRFLDFDERPLLRDAGHVSNQRMQQIVNDRYREFDSARKAVERDDALNDEAEDLDRLMQATRAVRQKEDGSDADTSE